MPVCHYMLDSTHALYLNTDGCMNAWLSWFPVTRWRFLLTELPPPHATRFLLSEEGATPGNLRPLRRAESHSSFSAPNTRWRRKTRTRRSQCRRTRWSAGWSVSPARSRWPERSCPSGKPGPRAAVGGSGFRLGSRGGPPEPRLARTPPWTRTRLG